MVQIYILEQKNENENTPLQAAIANKQIELVAFLIEKGSDVNVIQSGGWTGLHRSSIIRNEEIIVLLLKNGANKMIEKMMEKQPMILH